MQITALIKNDVADQHPDLVAEWGLSLYIKHQEKKILFDTGAKGALVQNAERLGVDLSHVDLVVLSHHHFDHGGGLPASSPSMTTPRSICVDRPMARPISVRGW
jgi:7,8-dihydropterin-6-yl-methyl-4-(beta-D-ribofuranosyl)aminobenzene 5'-phosphate synthase